METAAAAIEKRFTIEYNSTGRRRRRL